MSTKILYTSINYPNILKTVETLTFHRKTLLVTYCQQKALMINLDRKFIHEIIITSSKEIFKDILMNKDKKLFKQNLLQQNLKFLISTQFLLVTLKTTLFNFIIKD